MREEDHQNGWVFGGMLSHHPRCIFPTAESLATVIKKNICISPLGDESCNSKGEVCVDGVLLKGDGSASYGDCSFGANGRWEIQADKILIISKESNKESCTKKCNMEAMAAGDPNMADEIVKKCEIREKCASLTGDIVNKVMLEPAGNGNYKLNGSMLLGCMRYADEDQAIHEFPFFDY
jgi:hypothetical protein